MDWVGVIVERVSGLCLHDYCVKNIFTPLGINDMSFFPSQEMKERLAYMNQRYPDGHIAAREHLLRAALYPNAILRKNEIFNSAGAGL